MSPAAKITINDVLLWVGRAALAVIAFFAIGFYNEVHELRKDVNDALRTQAVQKYQIEALSTTTTEARVRLDRLEYQHHN